MACSHYSNDSCYLLCDVYKRGLCVCVCSTDGALQCAYNYRHFDMINCCWHFSNTAFQDTNLMAPLGELEDRI